jgi:hypothetical protein
MIDSWAVVLTTQNREHFWFKSSARIGFAYPLQQEKLVWPDILIRDGQTLKLALRAEKYLFLQMFFEIGEGLLEFPDKIVPQGFAVFNAGFPEGLFQARGNLL